LEFFHRQRDECHVLLEKGFRLIEFQIQQFGILLDDFEASKVSRYEALDDRPRFARRALRKSRPKARIDVRPWNGFQIRPKALGCSTAKMFAKRKSYNPKHSIPFPADDEPMAIPT
jgi:hypothetical protein